MGASKKRFDLIAIVLIFIAAVFLEYSESFSLMEDETLSYRHLLRTYNADAAVTAPSDDVVILYTDEEFYTEYDRYPLTRTDLAEIIRRLKKMGAAVIAVDMLLDFNSAYDEDPALEQALIDAGNVQLVSQAQFDKTEFIQLNKSIPKFADATSSGYSNVSSNSAVSEMIVRVRMYPEIGEAIGEWPYAVQAVASMLGTDDISIVDHVLRIGTEVEVQLDQFNDLYIDYPLVQSHGAGPGAKLHDVAGLSALEIYFLDEEELEDLAYLIEGKIVLIGEVAEVAHDEFETPVGNVFGVEIIANSIGTLLKNGPLQSAPIAYEILLAFLLMAALIATGQMTNPLPRNLTSLAALAVFLVINSTAYIYFGLVLSMSYLLLASLVSIALINARFYLAEMGQKAQIKDMFGQYLSPDVVSDLVKNPDKLSLGGEEREMTAYFSDIAGFSTFSENMTPSELVLVLNEYLTEMCNIIVSHQGTIDKFEGDAIIAFWGAPGLQPDHAKLSCLASVDMNKALADLRARWIAQGRPGIKVRMGLNTGRMVVGNMGSAQRMDYTMMGDAVNLAARLEGANKAFGSDLMISGSTYNSAKDFIDVRELDTIRVVGKSEPITVYQLLDRKDQTTGELADMVACYDEGLARYKSGDYVAAASQFESGLKIMPGDGPSETFFKRCNGYLENPPAADWDGVFTLDSKG